MYVLEGEAIVRDEEGKETPMKVGDVAFVPNCEKHQFANAGEGMLRFICVIPVGKEGER